MTLFERTSEQLDNTVDFKEFSEIVYKFGESEAHVEPYMYGSYEIFDANK